jgi:hypothetical protein
VRHLFAAVSKADAEAFWRVAGVIAKTIELGEFRMTVSHGRVCDAYVDRKARIPNGPEASETLNAFLGIDVDA